MINTTALGFISLAIGLGLCGVWFLHAFSQEVVSPTQKKIGLLLTLLFTGYSIQNGFMGLGTWLFAHNPEALFWIMTVDHILLTAVVMIATYAAYYIFSPHLSSRPALLFVGLVGTVLLITLLLSHPLPLLTPANSIDFNMNPLASFLTFYLLFMNIGAALYIFGRLLYVSSSWSLRLLCLVQCILALIGIVNVFTLLVLKQLDTGLGDPELFGIISGAIGLGFVALLILISAKKHLVRN